MATPDFRHLSDLDLESIREARVVLRGMEMWSYDTIEESISRYLSWRELSSRFGETPTDEIVSFCFDDLTFEDSESEIDLIDDSRPTPSSNSTIWRSSSVSSGAGRAASEIVRISDGLDPYILTDDGDSSNFRAGSGTANNNSSRETFPSYSEVQIIETESIAERSLRKVLLVYPQAKVDNVAKLLKSYNYNHERVITEMSEKGFEKEPGGDRVKKSSIDYTSTATKSSKEYIELVQTYIKIDFFYAKSKSILGVLNANNFRYYPSVKTIMTSLKSILPLEVYHKALSTLFSKVKLRTSGSTTSNSQAKVDLTDDNDIIIDVTDGDSSIIQNDQYLRLLHSEVTTALKTGKDSVNLVPSSWGTCHVYLYEPKLLLQELKDEMIFTYDKLKAELDRLNEELALTISEKKAAEEGHLIDCNCCFIGYSIESFVQCSEGHLFCKPCLNTYVHTAVFQNGNTKLVCMNQQTPPCPGSFTHSQLRASVDPAVMIQFNKRQSLEVLRLANMSDNVTTCRLCDYTAELAATDNILKCPNCEVDTCKLCGKDSHVPLKCSEVETDEQEKARKSVEEAMTAARIRECPNCKAKFYKVEGCNKMTCPTDKCGTKMCYICRADITHIKPDPYRHFCSTPLCTHKTCGICVLHSDSKEDDRRAMLEAGMKALEHASGSSLASGVGEGSNNSSSKKIGGKKSSTSSGSSSSSSGGGGGVPVVEATAKINIDRLLEGGPLAVSKAKRSKRF